MIRPLDVLIFSVISLAVVLLAIVRRRFAVASDSNKEQQGDPQGWLVRRDVILENDKRTSSVGTRFDQWLERTLIRAGVKFDRVTCILLIGCASLSAGAATFAFGLHPVFHGLSVIGVFVIGLLGCYLMMLSRIRKFGKQFPTSLDLLARATRAGENLENAFRIAGESSEEPVKQEFLQCVQQMRMGMSPALVTRDLAARIDSVDLHLLAHTISIHQKLGGKLAEALERLSMVIRSRAQCEEKVRSMTSIGRYSVLAIVFMGLFVLCYMLTSQPDYIDNLFTSNLGQKLLIYALVSEVVGLTWVGFTLKADL